MEGYELGWDLQLNGVLDKVTIPEGDYSFEVVSYERKRWAGNDKNPACNTAEVKLRVSYDDDKTTTITNTFFLHSNSLNPIKSFFVSIGVVPEGGKDSINVSFDQAIGGSGWCHVGFQKKNPQFNAITRFYFPSEAANIIAKQAVPETKPAAAPAGGAPW